MIGRRQPLSTTRGGTPFRRSECQTPMKSGSIPLSPEPVADAYDFLDRRIPGIAAIAHDETTLNATRPHRSLCESSTTSLLPTLETVRR